MTSDGFLIAVEGCDGAGTTTQARLLAEQLAHFVPRQGPNTDDPAVHLTRQPSEGPVGRMIREILAGGHRVGVAPPDPLTVALLFAADRVDHHQREVEPALNHHQVVVTDRWYHSSFAYNVNLDNIAGEACLLPEVVQNDEWITVLNAYARRPDLTFLLDIDAEEAARRRLAAGRTVELYDDIEVQRRVVARYRSLSGALGYTRVINGAMPIPAIAEEMLRVALYAIQHR